jgi:class 3 adenylate cyclase/HAMP domain-containing protein
MSQAAALSASPAPANRRRGIRIFNIRVKFAFFTGALIATVMAVVGYTLVGQQRQVLTHEVLGRAATVAENLAAAASEPLLLQNTPQADPLDLAFLAAKAVQPGASTAEVSGGHDLRSPEDWINGLQQAFTDLPADLARAVAKGVAWAGGEDTAAPGADAKAAAARSIDNEGIFQAVIVDASGKIASNYVDNAVWDGMPYVPRKIVQPASDEVPFPVYEEEVFSADKKVRTVRRLYDLQQPITLTNADGQEKALGVVHLGVDEDLVNREVFSVTMKLAAIALSAVLLGLLATVVTVTLMTRPIGRLVKGVLAIAGGDFDTRLKVASRDELGELTSSFNEMAVSLGQNELLKGAFTRYVSDAALQQILADPSATGLHSRRILATIYTSDVRGFTSMSETLQPEQVVQVINTYLSLQTEIILRHGGVVDKFIGDATIGVWGKEEARDTDALFAVRAAWEAQEAIAAMNAERAARGEIVKEIGIGVNTGEVVSGNMGSSRKMEYTVTGEHVIFADQICAECPGGKVWISASTYERVKEQVLVMPVQLSKGHENQVFQVTGFQS